MRRVGVVFIGAAVLVSSFAVATAASAAPADPADPAHGAP